MSIPFRNRIFLGLLALGTLPAAVALVALALQVRSTTTPAGRAALDQVAESGRAVINTLDTGALDEDARTVLRSHMETIARSTNLARRAEALGRIWTGALGVAILLATVVLVVVSIHLARRWSRFVSKPIEELVAWVQLIQLRQPLPASEQTTGPPEFQALRDALTEMSRALEEARTQELERERLVAFRETARRVAHEIRGPLSSSGLALAQLERSEQTNPSQHAAVEVLRDEVRRLEDMAREFSELGRLPEGPESQIDLHELLTSVLTASVPEHVHVQQDIDDATTVNGHYEPLRRAIRNLIENAVEATNDDGIGVAVENGSDDDVVCIRVSDHGPGISPELRDRIFQPYFTTKGHGTGLGLALVKQTAHAHGGTVTVTDTPGGGATFVLELPTAS